MLSLYKAITGRQTLPLPAAAGLYPYLHLSGLFILIGPCVHTHPLSPRPLNPPISPCSEKSHPGEWSEERARRHKLLMGPRAVAPLSCGKDSKSPTMFCPICPYTPLTRFEKFITITIPLFMLYGGSIKSGPLAATKKKTIAAITQATL